MKPIAFKEWNKVLQPPTGMANCVPLEVHCDNDGNCISKWQPSWKDRWNILLGKSIWVYVHSGKTQPPIALTVQNPFA